VDQELVDELRVRFAEEEEKRKLANVCEVMDEQTLSALYEIGIRAETVMAISLVPLVWIAWADGRIEAQEREAILRVAEQHDCPMDSAGYRLLEQWLAKPPSEGLINAWENYIVALSKELSDASLRHLADNILSRGRQIAKAAGGVLGIGGVSKQEHAVLHEIQAVFDRS
jgi:hypothetical protein